MEELDELEQSRGRRTRFGFAQRQRGRGVVTHHQQQQHHHHQQQHQRLPANDLQATWQAMQQETGWRPEEALLPYAVLVRYKKVSHEDAREGGVWVDIVGADGKPLRRNVGLLRYYGGVAFTSDDGAWAGVMLQGVRVAGGENDGRVGEIRYFACPRGQGLFLPERFVRRSFVQRPPPPPQPFTPPATSRVPRPRFYSGGAPVPASLDDVDSLETLLGLPWGCLGPGMADARAGVIYDLTPPQRPQQRSAKKAAAKLQLFQEMHATITGSPHEAPAVATQAGDFVKDEPLGATRGSSASSTMTETGLAAAAVDRAAITGSTVSWGDRTGQSTRRVSKAGAEMQEEGDGAFLRTQAFGRSASLSVSSSARSAASDSCRGMGDRARLEMVDLVQEALQMEAYHHDHEGGAGLEPATQVLAATAAMTTSTTGASGDVVWEEESATDEGSEEGMDRAAVYFEVAAQYLENLAAALAAQGAAREAEAEAGTTSRACLAAAVMAASSRRRQRPGFD